MAEIWSFDEYCEAVQALPCACFLLTTDIDFTIVCGNEIFYQLIGYSREDLQFHYGNRFSALVTGDSLRLFTALRDQAEPGKRVATEQNLRQQKSDGIWIYTEASYIILDGRPLLNCICYDISDYKLLENHFENYKSTFETISKMTQDEIFIYNLRNQTAVVETHGPILSQIDESVWLKYQNFQNAILSTQIVDGQYALAFQEAFWNIQKGIPGSYELKLIKENAACWYRLTLDLPSRKELSHCAIGILQDISIQKEATLKYLNESQFYQAILSEKDAYAQVDVTEDQVTRIGGMWNLYNELIHQVSYSQIIFQFINRVVHPDDRKHYLDLMQRDNFITSIDNGIDRLGCQFRRIVEQNKMMWMELNVHLFRDPLSQHVLALLYIKNIDESKRRELRLLQASEKDQVTNTYNRQAAETAIRNWLLQAADTDGFTFMVVNFDNLKEINDIFGRTAGDAALITLSDTLTELFRKNDIIGRFGGEEFIIFLSDIVNRQDVEKIITRLYSNLETAKEPRPSCRIGITQCIGEHRYEDIFQQADAALRAAKNSESERYCFYDETYIIPPVSIPQASGLPKDAYSDEEFTLILPSDAKNLSDDKLFDAFIGEQGDIAYLVDINTYDLIIGNEAFYNRIGLTRSQCFGLKCYEIMHKRDNPCPFCGRANWSRDRFYLWKDINDVLEQEFLIKNKLVTWKKKEVLLALAVDLSNNKSIVDSMDNRATESHYILNGTQRMLNAANLSDSMHSALETIAYFFGADSVQFWDIQDSGSFSCEYEWKRKANSFSALTGYHTTNIINRWLRSHEWNQPFNIESQETMLLHSFELYELMTGSNIFNQRWIPLKEESTLLGVLLISNITSNFQNLSFMDAFCCFMVSEWKNRALMERILYNNYHDDLTGLLSRNSYDNYLQAYDCEKLSSIGVIMADINDLKGINSRLGFPSGDGCIKDLSVMLQSIFTDTPIFRLNGDEFLVIQPDVGWDMMSDQCIQLEKQIGASSKFSVSIGRSWDNLEKNLPELIEQAIQSMKLNKRSFYNTHIQSQSRDRQIMMKELMNDLDMMRYEVYLQPKINFLTGAISGAEALIRYHHQEYGLLVPAKFIGNLEKNNFIRYIDLYVFREVCSVLQRWLDKGYSVPLVSLNFSRQTLLEHNLIKSVEHIFQGFTIPKKRLEIEITESIADMGKSALYLAVHDFYQAGYSISLDDFGTKYTNLSILSEVEFDTLKLDRSLTSALEKNSSNQVILRHIISMCRELNINVIAEGVETPIQEKILRELGCQYGQGYLYGRPMPIAEFEEKYMR